MILCGFVDVLGHILVCFEKFFERLIGRVHLKRGAAKTWTGQFDDAIEDLEIASRSSNVFT